MVGNDIIDIIETRRASNWERKGFMEKIFSTEEQARISLSNDPFTVAWQLWTIKESAYKVYIQAGGKPFFNPSTIECKLDNSNIGQVKIAELILRTNTVFNSRYIFSTATQDNAEVETCIFELPQSNNKQQSNFMNQQLLNKFAKKNSLNCVDLQIQKAESGVPRLYYKNRALNNSISFTHHGKYGAYSVILL